MVDYKQKLKELIQNGIISNEVAQKHFPELIDKNEKIKVFLRGLLLPHIDSIHEVNGRLVDNKDIDLYRKALAWVNEQGKSPELIELSKYDVEVLGSLITYLKGVLDECDNLEDKYLFRRDIEIISMIRNNLKSKIELAPSKSLEWTEQDKTLLEDTIGFLIKYQASDRCKDENDFQNSVSCKEWLEERFKFLVPNK